MTCCCAEQRAILSVQEVQPTMHLCRGLKWHMQICSLTRMHCFQDQSRSLTKLPQVFVTNSKDWLHLEIHYIMPAGKGTEALFAKGLLYSALYTLN